MGRISKKFIAIFCVIIICAIYIPTILLPYYKIFQVENRSATRMRPISKWDIEYVLNGTVFREFENAIDEQLSSKEKFGKLYACIHQFLNKNMVNARIVESNSYVYFYHFIMDKNRDDLNNETTDKIEYFKKNYQINSDGIYIAYKVILNKMNNKNLNNNPYIYLDL